MMTWEMGTSRLGAARRTTPHAESLKHADHGVVEGFEAGLSNVKVVSSF